MRSTHMKSTLVIAALFAATTAYAQSSLTLPNNSAGTVMDTPPVLPAGPDVLVPVEPRDGATRRDVEQLAGPKQSDAADKNRDGRVDEKELRELRDAPAPIK